MHLVLLTYQPVEVADPIHSLLIGIKNNIVDFYELFVIFIKSSSTSNIAPVTFNRCSGINKNNVILLNYFLSFIKMRKFIQTKELQALFRSVFTKIQSDQPILSLILTFCLSPTIYTRNSPVVARYFYGGILYLA